MHCYYDLHINKNDLQELERTITEQERTLLHFSHFELVTTMGFATRLWWNTPTPIIVVIRFEDSS